MEVIDNVGPYDLSVLEIGDIVKVDSFCYKVDNVVKDYKGEEGRTFYEFYAYDAPFDSMIHNTCINHVNCHDTYSGEWLLKPSDRLQILKCDN